MVDCEPLAQPQPWPVKEFLKQLTPPILLAAKRALFERPSTETPEQRRFRTRHEELNREMGRDEICIRSGLNLKLHPESRDAFEAFCYSYPEMVEEMDCFLRLTLDTRKLLDIGALHGIFSLVFMAAAPDRRAVAVDASALAFARLLYNIHKNQFSDISPIECAMSDEAGVVRMHYEWEHAVAAGTEVEGPAGLLVEKRTADSLCASLNFDPDVIKIDVEGHEVKVLKGLRLTLQRCRPLVFLEIHPYHVQMEHDRLQEVEELFSGLGYRAESMAGQSIPLTSIPAFKTFARVVLHPN